MTIRPSVLLLAAGLLAGCAATIPNELASARTAYQTVISGAASTLVPAEVHKAHEALLEAEAAFKDDPKGYHTRDLAYVAQRKAELAGALAATAAERGNTAAANAEYQVRQDAVMKDTRARLGASETDLAASKSDLANSQSNLAASQSQTALTAAQLATSETARALAEKRASDAMSALAKLAAVKEESRGLVITLSGSVLFRSDEATLLSAAQDRLGQVSDALLETKERHLLVEGHTDSQGSDAHNQDLSQRRADAVRSYLIQRGYDPTLVQAVGIGEGRPVGDNNSAEGRANNRRVEIVIQPAVASTN